jgi:hypothetical protein
MPLTVLPVNTHPGSGQVDGISFENLLITLLETSGVYCLDSKP